MSQLTTSDPAFSKDPAPLWANLRKDCPVARSEDHGGFWVLSRYEDVRKAALDWRTFTSSVVGVTAIPQITPRTQPMLPIELDPPQHSRYRALVAPVFSAERVAEITPGVTALIRARLAALHKAGRGDLVAELAMPVAVGTLAQLTELPAEDQEQWVGWVLRLFSMSDRSGAAAAGRELSDYVLDLIAARRASPTGDVISRLIAAEVEGERLDDARILSFVTVLFGAGFETTADGMSVMLHYLETDPGLRAALEADPDLVAPAVEEILRLGSPVQMFGRNTTCPVDLHGRTIPQGDIVALGFAAANRDPAVFDAPDRLCPNRSPNRHLAFGAGPHLCAGAAVARMEMTMLLREILAAGLYWSASAPPEWKTRADRRGLARYPVTLRTA
jgi:cytochrome P450